MIGTLLVGYAGGIVGAVVMDIAETLAARRGISSGVNVALVGRWSLALGRGVFRHDDIRRSPAHANEIAAGWLFHFFVGGGGVALLLPLTLHALPASPLPYLGFGLATSLLPWFILLPSFGWGIAGRRGPPGSNALLASTLSHIPYGAGIWLTAQVAAPLLAA